ncbi:Esterase/lipase/thioesterase, partial [Heterobasidion irregulare TC 32-1]
LLPPFLHSYDLKTQGEDGTYYHTLYHHASVSKAAHTIWWPPVDGEASTPSTVLLFIPGNPGLLGFYVPFLSAIWKGSAPGLAILAHSYIGHTPGIEPVTGRKRSASTVGLHVQIQTIIEVLDDIVVTFGTGTKVVLVGHSVGSWLTLQVLKARPNVVSGTFLLFPTITNIADTPNGRLLSWLFHPPLPRLVSYASFLVRHLPHRILLLLFSSWPREQIIVLQSLLQSPSTIWASLSMAHEEMGAIREMDIALLEEHHEHIWFYFAENDAWVGKHREIILETMHDMPAGVKVIHGGTDIPHAFCI